MRRLSSPSSLKYLPITATDTAMSSRPPYRPRGDRNGTLGRGELVTRDGNQKVGRGGFPNQLEFQTLPVNRRPHVNQNQHFIRPIPHSNRPLSSQPYWHSNQNHHLSPHPPFEQNQPTHQYPYRLQPPGSPLQFHTMNGDSRYKSARDANLHFRPGARGGFSNQAGFQAPPPHFTQYQPFNHIPRFNADQPQNPMPHVNQNQSFITHLPFQQNQSIRQPHAKSIQRPSEFIHREWEYARPGPPLHCDRFIVLSYNLLADYLAINHWDQLYSHIPNHMLEWNWRKRNIIYELGWWSADILCLQEVDRFRELEDELKTFGYSGIWKMRTGDAVDGCAIFWRASRFKLLQEECIEYNKLGLRNNVAQICVLESLRQNNTASVPRSSTGSNKVVICNIHVLFNPKRGEIKLGQVRILLEKAHAISKIWNNAPIVFCGDFNCTPKSPLYNFFSEQKLDLTSLARDKLSGQDSCVIRSPRQFSSYQAVPSAYVSVRPPTVTKGPDIGANQSDSLTDMRDQNVSDVLGKSSINGNNVTESTAPSDETSKEHYEGSEIGYKDETEPSSFEPSFQSDEGSEADKTAEIKLSDHVYVDSDTKNTKHKDDVIASSSDNGVSCKHPASNLSQVDVSNASTSIDCTLDENIVKLFVYEPDKEMKVDTNVEKEDCDTFLSELHNTDGDFSSDIGKFGSTDLVERDVIEKDGTQGDANQNKISPDRDFAPYRTFYDPSSWTPVEIETATGNAECTIIEHPLKLRSTYTEVEDLLHTRGVNGEPEVTSYNKCFLGTVDYIWRSEGLQTVRTLAPIPKHAMQWTRGFPTKKWGSDHIALASELAFAMDTTDENMQTP